MNELTCKLKNLISKYLFNRTSRETIVNEPRNQVKKKIKVKHHIPRIQKWISQKRDVLTVFIVGVILMTIWFIYLFLGTWSPAKFKGNIEQYDEIELPGKNPFDKK